MLAGRVVRVICAGDVPDHVTIARFRAAFRARWRTVRLGAAAVRAAGDGEPGHGRAGRDEDRRERVEVSEPDRGGLRKLAAESVAAHAAADAADDAAAGRRARGGRVPPPGGLGRDSGSRRRWRRSPRAAGKGAAGERAGRSTWPGRAGPAAAASVASRRRRPAGPPGGRAAQLTELERRAAGPADTGRRRDRPRAGAEDYCLVKVAGRRWAKLRPGPPRRPAPPPARPRPGPTSPTPTRGSCRPATGSSRATTPERDQRRRPDHRHRADPRHHRHRVVEPMLRHAEDAAALITGCQPPRPAGPRSRTARSG